MNKNNTCSYTGILMIVTAAVCWGLSAVLFIPSLYNLPTAFVVLFQNLLSLILLSIAAPKEYLSMIRLPWMTLFLLSLIGLFSGVIGTLAIVKALFLVQFKQLSVVVLIQKVQPIFTILLAVIFLREKLSRNFIYWSVVVIIGVYLITFGLHLPDHSINPDWNYTVLKS